MTKPVHAIGSTWVTSSPLDRIEDRRDDQEWVQAQWRHTGARVLAVTPSGQIAWADRSPGYRRPVAEFGPQHSLLGLVAGNPVFAESVAELEGSVPVRAVMDSLDTADLEIVFTASALATWHADAHFCGTCGAATVPIRGGFVRQCPGCGRELYPRVDPAMIVAVADSDDRLLMGRQPTWEPGRMSVLAGFVAPGESLEQAVHREVFEEVGVRLAEVVYISSQPWPFPRSLMLAFAARAEDTRLAVATTELEEARWFSRVELAAALAAGEVKLPTRTSVAYRLICAWREGRLRVDG